VLGGGLDQLGNGRGQIWQQAMNRPTHSVNFIDVLKMSSLTVYSPSVQKIFCKILSRVRKFVSSVSYHLHSILVLHW